MKQFTKFYLENAAELATAVDYVALPKDLYEKAKNNLDNRVTGTHYLDAEMKKRSGALSDVFVADNITDIR